MAAFEAVPADIPCEDLATSDEFKTDAAIAMALCDIRTGDEFKIPQECADWERNKGHASAKKCVG